MSPDKIFTFMVLLLVAAAAVKDFKSRQIPDTVNILIVVIGFVKIIVLAEMRKSSIVGFVCAAVLMTICKLVMKDGLGAGDVKLISALGFFLGISRFIPFMVITSLVSVIVATVMVILKKMKKNDSLPFAPLVLVGYILNMIFLYLGGRII